MSSGLFMVKRRVRYQAWLDPADGGELERWAHSRGKSLSESLAYLAMRGLRQESAVGQGADACQGAAWQARAIDSLAAQIEQLEAAVDALECREADRFLRLLGHLQKHQAVSTELVGLERVMFMDIHDGRDYQQVIEKARQQVFEDAKLFRESVAIAGPPRRKRSA